MNPKVKAFIEKQKEKQKSEKESHLKRLGFVNKQPNGLLGVIDITDEEYAEICKYSNPNEDVKSKSYYVINNDDETRLYNMSTVVLIVGIISTVILLIMMFVFFDGYSTEDLGYICLAAVPAVLISTFSIVYLYRVLSNISLTLKEIRKDNR